MSHKRYAYCLGANGPRSSWYEPLKYAEKDAERLATALATSPCDFTETKWGVASDRASTLAGLSQFLKQCESPDLLIVHFSGHASSMKSFTFFATKLTAMTWSHRLLKLGQ
jgi:hypothetical protein